jgi:probable phosphoglycerate mutase
MPAAIPHQTFLFLRHGQTEWNHLGRIQGRTDVPLNPTGLAQAQQAAAQLQQAVLGGLTLAQHLGLPHQQRYPNAQPLAVTPAWHLTNLAGQPISS